MAARVNDALDVKNLNIGTVLTLATMPSMPRHMYIAETGGSPAVGSG
jgi:hypothetical protein